MSTMRAVQILNDRGPRAALRLAEVAQPEGTHPLTPGAGVLIDVHAAGASFPELLQTYGKYQDQPPLPFIPGAEVSGIVRSVIGPADVALGDRVCALCLHGAWAEAAVAPAYTTFALPDALSFTQGAGLVVNYHTALFALQRAQMRAGERVLIHGGAGGLGSAAIQVVKGLGGRPIAVVSSEAKQAVAFEAGAEHVVRTSEDWRAAVRELCRGVDLVFDPVGGERFTDSLRVLRDGGRIVVVGFTDGTIPQVKVNRLLFRNIGVIGAAWGIGELATPDAMQAIGSAVTELVLGGAIQPIIGGRFPLGRAADALMQIEERRAVGKLVLDIR
jgi:NADPH2:quinone reductase